MSRHDNYPDDIRQYDNDPRSPFYVEPPDEVEDDGDADYEYDRKKDMALEIAREIENGRSAQVPQHIIIGTGFDPSLTHAWKSCYLDNVLSTLMGTNQFKANVLKPVKLGDHSLTYETDTGLYYDCVITITEGRSLVRMGPFK